MIQCAVLTCPPENSPFASSPDKESPPWPYEKWINGSEEPLKNNVFISFAVVGLRRTLSSSAKEGLLVAVMLCVPHLYVVRRMKRKYIVVPPKVIYGAVTSGGGG